MDQNLSAVFFGTITGIVVIVFIRLWANLTRIPRPVWFWFANLPVYIPFAYLGSKLRK